ncbi:two-component response regulator [Primorskyibacter flagellatus]|uniref:Two-component response regulator n=1 Tax=Primorskyibacter flagellatus TaxID=1387277 RepID=A0A917ACJ0_9RHOB|nr:response regulator [Primorskyibacter flagellatus]GGE42166.1 two-component response regulator [Primorskyibacter flagellatus]
MNQTVGSEDFAMNVAMELPYLRRYARALTGSQTSGDNYAAATLEAMLEDPGLVDRTKNTRLALFGAFHAIWTSSGAPVAVEESGIAARAQDHLSRLTPNTREALLLATIEDFSTDQIGEIMGIGRSEAEELVRIAQRELAESVTGRVMVIEDEAIIAMDLQSIVSEMGHTVTGVARTRSEAVALGKAERPDLIFADIQLADNSSGIDAVNDLLAELGDVPVIFITAYPERLLTGEKAEPAFLITKPYTEEQVRLAASQAMFFASTETLQH